MSKNDLIEEFINLDTERQNMLSRMMEIRSELAQHSPIKAGEMVYKERQNGELLKAKVKHVGCVVEWGGRIKFTYTAKPYNPVTKKQESKKAPLFGDWKTEEGVSIYDGATE